MTFLLARAWAGTKRYWYVAAAVVGFVIAYFILRRSDGDLESILRDVESDHRKDLESIARREAEVERARADAEHERLERLAEIERRYALEREHLDEETRRRADRILESTRSDPSRLAERLANVLGSKYERTQ